ncbi:MAG TPA: helix-turn-helix domain-containing protein [Clostridiales bacterium]|nr:helix-turn-helix domain-containing protein [Clostridiales bacterium]
MRRIMFEKKLPKKLFKKSLFSYFIILLIPIVIIGIIYLYVLGVVTENSIKFRENMLEQTRNAIDLQFSEIENLVIRLNSDDRINYLAAMNTEEYWKDSFQVYETSLELAKYKSIRAFVDEIYIYFLKGKYALSEAGSLNADLFYNMYFESSRVNREVWNDVINNYNEKQYLSLSYLSHLSGDVTTENNPDRAVFIQSIPIGYKSRYEAKAVVFMNMESLKGYLQKNNTTSSCFTYILSNGKIIASSNPETSKYSTELDVQIKDNLGYVIKDIAGEKMLVTYSSSYNNEWVYVSVMPTYEVTNQVKVLRNIFTIACILCFFLGISGAIVFTYHNYKPIQQAIKDLVEYTKESFEEMDSNFINYSVNNLINENVKMKDRIEEYFPYIKNEFLLNLIYGRMNHKEIITIAGQLNIALDNRCFTVVIYTLSRYERSYSADILRELFVSKIAVEDQIKNICDCYYGLELDNDKVAFLLIFNKIDENYSRYIKEKIEQITKKLHETNKIKLRFSIGDVVHDCNEIPTSYRKAKHLMDYSIIVNNKESVLTEIQRIEGMYYYPIDVENSLITMAKAGDYNGVIKLLDGIYSYNFVKTELGIDIIMCLYEEIFHTLIKTITYVFAEEKDKAGEMIKKCKDIDYMRKPLNVFDRYKEVFGELCMYSNDKKVSHNDRMKTRILEYLDIHYRDNNISLAVIADYFEYSEVYFSCFFKEQIGENFSTYLNRMRLKKACELLKQTEQEINEISAATGYTNSHIFRRTFKKYFGVTPSDYRSIPELHSFRFTD